MAEAVARATRRFVTFNSIEWIPGLGVGAGSSGGLMGLSIPLNGFTMKEFDTLIDMIANTFNSIEWIPLSGAPVLRHG